MVLAEKLTYCALSKMRLLAKLRKAKRCVGTRCKPKNSCTRCSIRLSHIGGQILGFSIDLRYLLYNTVCDYTVECSSLRGIC